MDERSQNNICKDMDSLANAGSDSLRASQRLFARLIFANDQEEAIKFAIETFLRFTHPQRVALLQEVEFHINQDRRPCPAFARNGQFFDCLLQRLEQELSRKKRALILKRYVHGTRAEVSQILKLTEATRHSAQGRVIQINLSSSNDNS